MLPVDSDSPHCNWISEFFGFGHYNRLELRFNFLAHCAKRLFSRVAPSVPPDEGIINRSKVFIITQKNLSAVHIYQAPGSVE
jgi:hypothetical protein